MNKVREQIKAITFQTRQYVEHLIQLEQKKLVVIKKAATLNRGVVGL